MAELHLPARQGEVLSGADLRIGMRLGRSEDQRHPASATRTPARVGRDAARSPVHRHYEPSNLAFVAAGSLPRREGCAVRNQRIMVVAAFGMVVLTGLAVEANAAVAPSTMEVTVSSAGVDANRASQLDWMSKDGRFVLFDSTATNLVRHDTNGVRDVFLRDTVAQRTVRFSVGPHGRQANGPSWGGSVSADGTKVSFRSTATDLTRQRSRI